MEKKHKNGKPEDPKEIPGERRLTCPSRGKSNRNQYKEGSFSRHTMRSIYNILQRKGFLFCTFIVLELVVHFCTRHRFYYLLIVER